MSSTNRRDSSRAVRAFPKAAPFDEVTTPDARAPHFPDGQRHAGFPSFTTPVRSASSGSNARRSGGGGPAASTTPPNVIPFTKPRAIAAIAAANPAAVVTMAPAPAASTSQPASHGSPTRNMASATQAIALDPRVSTGWTPPHGVKAVAQPASARQPVIAVTAWPAANAPAQVQSPAQAPAQARGVQPQALPPVMHAQPAQVAVAPVAYASYAPSYAPTPAFAPAPAHAPVFVPSAAPPAAPAFAPPPPAHVTTTRPASQMTAAPLVAQPNKTWERWAEYLKLGLGPPKINTQKLIVNAYRLLGFVILTIIVIVLVGYIASQAFYYMSNSWIMPMAVSPTDEKVVSLQAQLAEQQNTRDRIADDLQQSERAILAQQTFQAEFAKAIRSDLEGRKLALNRIRDLASAASRTRASIKSQNAAYANASRHRMAQEYAAGLIDRNAMLSGKYQIAQITSSNLTLAERQAEFETRAAELEAQTRSLDAILANAGGTSPALSYEVLRIKQEYEASRLDLAKSMEARKSLQSALARQDKIVASLEQSAYLRAIRDKASVAFVPYANLENVKKGTSLYACKLGMLFCYNVGAVLEVLPGEVQFKHPQRERNLRGQLVVLKLAKDDADAAAEDVLFLDGRPILF
jgi:hypothetical protein